MARDLSTLVGELAALKGDATHWLTDPEYEVLRYRLEAAHAAAEAALETSLSVEEANRMLFDLAAKGPLQVIVEHGRLLYSFWGHEAPP